jgi:hypothetical protein
MAEVWGMLADVQEGFANRSQSRGKACERVTVKTM